MNFKYKLIFVFSFLLVACQASMDDDQSAPGLTSTPPPPTSDNASLTARSPSVEQVEAYLRKFTSSASIKLSPDTPLAYEDINGDNEKDIIVPGTLSVFLLLWTGSGYAKPFVFSEKPEHYDSSSHVSFADWTEDGIPEIIFDYRGVTGGTGLNEEYWIRRIIHCVEDTCEVVWQAPVGALVNIDDAGFPGMELFLNRPVLVQTADGNPMIVQTSHAFTFGSRDQRIASYLSDPVYNQDCLRLYECHQQNIFGSELTLYRWTGKTFEKNYETLISGPLSFPEFVPSANTNNTAANFTFAEVFVIPDDYIFPNEPCRLKIGGKIVGQPFHCYPNYVSVDWLDVTGDGQPEVVIKALFGPRDIDGNLVTDKDCFHERMLIYQWDGKQAQEIANLTGCVVREDLFGVRLEDSDGDGTLEIISAGKWLTDFECAANFQCWEELNYNDQLYKWNGTNFAFWRERPRT